MRALKVLTEQPFPRALRLVVIDAKGNRRAIAPPLRSNEVRVKIAAPERK